MFNPGLIHSCEVCWLGLEAVLIHQEDGILSGFGLGDNPSGCLSTR